MGYKMKEIPRYPGYFATEDGRILSTRYGNLRELKGCANTSGYLKVTPSVNNRKHSEQIHVLILETFFGERPFGAISCHGEGGKLDNSIRNLSWGNHLKNNGADRKRDGTVIRGNNISTSKLKKEQVLDILSRCESGIFSYAEIARKFRVSGTTITSIYKKRIWNWI